MSSSDLGKKLRKKPESAVIGIDLSSTKFAAVVTLDERYVTHTKVKFRTLMEVKAALESLLDGLPGGNFPTARAYIEEAVVARGGSRVTIQQAYAMGAVRLTLEERGWNVSLVNVGTWKKQVVGSGRADKSSVSGWFRGAEPHLFGLFGGDQDLIDAACVGRYGAGVLRTARILDERGAMPRADAPLLLQPRRRRATEG